jgi:fructokinase
MATQPADRVIAGLGEVLWDLLPDGPQLGGAPFNFTFHCAQLGHAAVMVSRVGRDLHGWAVREAMDDLGLSDDFVQEDRLHPTGTVAVTMDAQRRHTFTITPDVAYDHLEWDESLEGLFRQARAVCFGTLAQRGPVSRATVHRALAAAPQDAVIVYDVNLRQHYYSREVIEASLHAARWAKLNEDELAVLRDLLGLGGTDSEALAALRRRYGLELTALTRGERGCLIQTAREEVEAPGVSVAVVDTIGAGDAFAAGLLAYRLEGRPLAEAAAFANRLAARVAASAGGTPRIERAEVEPPAHG